VHSRTDLMVENPAKPKIDGLIQKPASSKQILDIVSRTIRIK
jgi:hypothetical protein